MITLNQIKIALGIIFLGVLLFGAWHEGRHEVRDEFDAYMAEETTKLLKATQDNEALKTLLEVHKNEAQTRIDALANNVRTQFVRLPATTCIKPANGARGVEAAITSRELLSTSPASPQAALDRFMEESDADAKRADEITEQCRVIQDWSNHIEFKE